LILLILSTQVPAQEHQHPAKDQVLHDNFYSTWARPNDPRLSCCGNKDCYPTQFQRQGGKWFALRREDGALILVPPAAFEHNRRDDKPPRESPDLDSHVCMQPPGQSDQVFCAVLGIGG
jgi:hypothetical protein